MLRGARVWISSLCQAAGDALLRGHDLSQLPLHSGSKHTGTTSGGVPLLSHHSYHRLHQRQHLALPGGIKITGRNLDESISHARRARASEESEAIV